MIHIWWWSESAEQCGADTVTVIDLPQKVEKESEIWAKHTSILSVSYLYFTCYIETLVKSTRHMATSPAPARSHMGKLHKKYELTDQVGKGCRLSVSGLVRRLSAPRFCSHRESGWMEPQLEQTHPSLLPSSSVQPVEGTRACIPDTQRLIWGKTEREINVKFLWTPLYEADHMTRGGLDILGEECRDFGPPSHTSAYHHVILSGLPT